MSVEHVVSALDRLFRVASADTGTSRKVSNFLLACWNAGANGGFDPTDCWSMDEKIRNDIITVFVYVVNNNTYFDSLGFEKEIKDIAEKWRT